MHYTDLKGRQVVALDTADTLGHVADGVMAREGLCFAGLKINLSGLFSGSSAVRWDDIYGIGADAITLKEGHILKDAERTQELAGLPSANDILGDRVMSEYGTELGTVGDIDLNGETGQVNSFLLSEGLLGNLTHKVRAIDATDVQSVGNNLVTVSEHSVHAE